MRHTCYGGTAMGAEEARMLLTQLERTKNPKKDLQLCTKAAWDPAHAANVRHCEQGGHGLDMLLIIASIPKDDDPNNLGQIDICRPSIRLCPDWLNSKKCTKCLAKRGILHSRPLLHKVLRECYSTSSDADKRVLSQLFKKENFNRLFGVTVRADSKEAKANWSQYYSQAAGTPKGQPMPAQDTPPQGLTCAEMAAEAVNKKEERTQMLYAQAAAVAAQGGPKYSLNFQKTGTSSQHTGFKLFEASGK